VLVRASRFASGPGRPWLRRAGLCRAWAALGHGVTLAVAHMLLLGMALVLHLPVALGMGPLGLHVLASGDAVAMTLRLCQGPSPGKHRGRRDAADEQNLRFHVCLSNPGQPEKSVACVHWSGRISPKFFSKDDCCDKVCQRACQQYIDIH
jgi:hypothetical protein